MSSPLQQIISERDADLAADDEAEKAEADKRNEVFECFYSMGPGQYLYKSSNHFIRQNESNVIRRIKKKGFSVNEALDFCLDIQEKNTIERTYQYQPARPAGVYRIGNIRYAVMYDYPFPYHEGAKGTCDTIISCLRSLFGEVQLPYLLAWLKGARRRIIDTMTKGDYSTACQVLAILGTHDTGKTNILCKRIMHPLFGGEVVNYGKMLKHGNQFNAELMNGCLLVADDEGKPQGQNARRRMADTMKSIGYNGCFGVEGKGKDTFSIRAPWVQVILANDDDSGLESIPDFSGMEDKFIALHAEKRPDFPPNKTDEDKRKLDAAIAAEIPAFAWYVDHYTPPPEIQGESGRHECKEYVAPFARDLLQPLTEEARLMNAIEMLISDALTVDRICDSSGIAAAALQAELKRKNLWKDENGRSLGRKLSRLCSQYPNKISTRTLNGKALYIVTRPADVTDEE